MELNKYYTFRTISPEHLGSTIKGKVLSIEPFRKAVKYAVEDLATLHAAIYTTIGSGILIPNIQNSTFLEIEESAGETRYLNMDWIVPDSIEEVPNIKQLNLILTGEFNVLELEAYLKIKGIDYSLE